MICQHRCRNLAFPGCAMVINGVRARWNRRASRVRAKGAAYRHQHRDPAYLFA